MNTSRGQVHVDFWYVFLSTWTTYPPQVDNHGQLADHPPTPFCPRGFWMTPCPFGYDNIIEFLLPCYESHNYFFALLSMSFLYLSLKNSAAMIHPIFFFSSEEGGKDGGFLAIKVQQALSMAPKRYHPINYGFLLFSLAVQPLVNWAQLLCQTSVQASIYSFKSIAWVKQLVKPAT